MWFRRFRTPDLAEIVLTSSVGAAPTTNAKHFGLSHIVGLRFFTALKNLTQPTVLIFIEGEIHQLLPAILQLVPARHQFGSD
jgi:hypothetical protein